MYYICIYIYILPKEFKSIDLNGVWSVSGISGTSGAFAYTMRLEHNVE